MTRAASEHMAIKIVQDPGARQCVDTNVLALNPLQAVRVSTALCSLGCPWRVRMATPGEEVARVFTEGSSSRSRADSLQRTCWMLRSTLALPALRQKRISSQVRACSRIRPTWRVRQSTSEGTPAGDEPVSADIPEVEMKRSKDTAKNEKKDHNNGKKTSSCQAAVTSRLN